LLGCDCGSSHTALAGGGSFSPSVPLLSGDAGIAQTVSLMYKLIDEGVKDRDVNAYAVDIIRSVPQFDPLAQANAIYETVHGAYYFVNDPMGTDGPKETLRPAREVMALGAGDCDDFTILLGSLLGTIGMEVRIRTAAVDPSDPEIFSHVYPEVKIHGQWVPVDAARPGAQFGLAPEHSFRDQIWPRPDSHGTLGRFRRHTLSGYIVLGDAISDIITAGETGAADILAASRADPSNIYGQLSTNPNASITPYSPLATAGYAGYQYATPPGALAVSSSVMPWLLMGIAAIVLLGRKI
jgi:Transglutaminase-like superfamily